MSAAWLTEGFPDETPAEVLIPEDLGRFACALCADNRDAAEASAAQLARAHALLRQIARANAAPARELIVSSDDPRERVILGHVAALAVIKARIELYFAAKGE
jgi:hypothetical protein